MIWHLLPLGEDAIVLQISDGFFEWLRDRADDPHVRAFDPYVDAKLDAEALTRWQSALARVVSSQKRRAENEFRATRQLPRDASVRELLLADWVELELSDDPQHRTLRELEATIALALETGAEVTTIGD